MQTYLNVSIIPQLNIKSGHKLPSIVIKNMEFLSDITLCTLVKSTLLRICFIMR